MYHLLCVKVAAHQVEDGESVSRAAVMLDEQIHPRRADAMRLLPAEVAALVTTEEGLLHRVGAMFPQVDVVKQMVLLLLVRLSGNPPHPKRKAQATESTGLELSGAGSKRLYRVRISWSRWSSRHGNVEKNLKVLGVLELLVTRYGSHEHASVCSLC